jgi:protease II
MTDTKRERFVRIAEKRVNTIIEALLKLENCSNTNNYKYNEEDVKKIFTEIEKRVKEAKTKFQDTPKEKPLFKLDRD